MNKVDHNEIIGIALSILMMSAGIAYFLLYFK